jgi:hypothetical protein
MKLNSICAALAFSAVATLGIAGNAQAYTTFFGEDLNSSNSTPLSSIPNASAAEASFKSNLSNVGTENFESQATGASAPLALTFPGFGGGSLNAILSGGGGAVASVTPGTTNNAGRYSIPSASSSKYWQVSAGGGGNFTITFAQSIAALGFYGIDIGDFGGQLTLGVNGSTQTVNNTIGSGGSTDGSVLFYGLIAAVGEEFTSVSFNTTTGGGDVFAFDNFTIGSREQVCTPGTPGCGGTVP